MHLAGGAALCQAIWLSGSPSVLETAQAALEVLNLRFAEVKSILSIHAGRELDALLAQAHRERQQDPAVRNPWTAHGPLLTCAVHPALRVGAQCWSAVDF